MAITLGLALRVDHAPAMVLQPEQELRSVVSPVLNVTPIIDPVISSHDYMRNAPPFKENQPQAGSGFSTYSQRGEGRMDALTGRNLNIFA